MDVCVYGSDVPFPIDFIQCVFVIRLMANFFNNTEEIPRLLTFTERGEIRNFSRKKRREPRLLLTLVSFNHLSGLKGRPHTSKRTPQGMSDLKPQRHEVPT